MPSLILCAGGDRDFIETLEQALHREGHQTRYARTGKAAIEQISKGPIPDIVLLNARLPDTTGLEVCKAVRQSNRTSYTVIILLSDDSDEIDRIVALELGADDYLVKPLSIRELLLRIRSVLRRNRPRDHEQGSITFGSLRIDEGAYRIWVANEEIVTTALEFRLLTRLLQRKGQVQTREELLTEVWGTEPGTETRTVDTHIKRLRKKLGTAGTYIETVRCVGYRFSESPDGDKSRQSTHTTTLSVFVPEPVHSSSVG